MITKLKCRYCKIVYEVDDANVSTDSQYLQCPWCGLIMDNPFWKEETKDEQD